MKLLLASALILTQAPTQWVPPYKALEMPKDESRYVDLMKDKKEQVVLEGDTLSFLFKSKSEKVDLMNNFSLQLKRIPESDVWMAQAKMEGWDKAFFNYCFVDGGYKAGNRIEMKSWWGSNAPKRLKEAASLQGKVETFTVSSKALGQERKVTVYLPPRSAKSLPAVYLADGQGCEAYAKLIEPLILEGKVRPVALDRRSLWGVQGRPQQAFRHDSGFPREGVPEGR